MAASPERGAGPAPVLVDCACALLEAIRSVREQPVRRLIVTNCHADNFYDRSAFDTTNHIDSFGTYLPMKRESLQQGSDDGRLLCGWKVRQQ